MKSRWMQLGYVMGAMLLVLPAAVGCGSKSKGTAGSGSSSSAAKIGDTVSFDDSDWVVADAKDLGNKLTSNLDETDTKVSDQGKYVQVHFKVTNKGKKTVELVLNPPKIVDGNAREFLPVDLQSFYVPKNAKTLGLESLPPTLQRDCYTIIEVPKDAKGLKFEMHGLGLSFDNKTVDLGI